MSSSDGGKAGARRTQTLLLALAASLALAACTVRPLYGPTANGASVQNILAKIAIDSPDSRVAQVVRNKLIFSLNGGAGMPTSPVYQMHLTVNSSEAALGINDVDSAPSYAVIVSASYQIKLVSSGAIVLQGTSQNEAIYDRVNQIYANVRAHLDAENRAAALVATDIQTRIAIAAVNGLNPLPPVAATTTTSSAPGSATPAPAK